jgi:hypothetical protein
MLVMRRLYRQVCTKTRQRLPGLVGSKADYSATAVPVKEKKNIPKQTNTISTDNMIRLKYLSSIYDHRGVENRASRPLNRT